MGAPVFDPARVPFDAAGLAPRRVGGCDWWPLDAGGARVEVACCRWAIRMRCSSSATSTPRRWRCSGPARSSAIARFPRRVNAGFMQVVDRGDIRLRVYERGAGETLACGTGACAAVVAGIRSGWLDRRVDVDTRGGRLTIEWAGGDDDRVLMTGPAETVFEGEIEL